MSSDPSSSSSTSKRHPSLPSSSTEATLSSIDTPPKKVGSVIVKHGKWVAIGAAGCCWVDLPNAIRRVLDDQGGWVRKMMITGLSLHVATIVIFLYLVVFLPWIRRYVPNYPKWQESARLRVIVPLLTSTILLGWTCLVISLSQAGKTGMLQSAVDAVKAVGNASLAQMSGGRGLGVFSSMLGATSLYTFTLGILGFIPAPRDVPVRVKAA